MTRKMTTAQVADAFGVTARTVQRWADEGAIPSTRTLGGARRFDPTTIQAKLSSTDE